jgi:hypothetical protein
MPLAALDILLCWGMWVSGGGGVEGGKIGSHMRRGGSAAAVTKWDKSQNRLGATENAGRLGECGVSFESPRTSSCLNWTPCKFSIRIPILLSSVKMVIISTAKYTPLKKIHILLNHLKHSENQLNPPSPTLHPSSSLANISSSLPPCRAHSDRRCERSKRAQLARDRARNRV